MPGGNGTGPMGQGRRSGRGLGSCGGGIGFSNRGCGRGFGVGNGMGFGRRCAGQYFSPATQSTQKDDVANLKTYSLELETEFEAVKKRLAELGKK